METLPKTMENEELRYENFRCSADRKNTYASLDDQKCFKNDKFLFTLLNITRSIV